MNIKEIKSLAQIMEASGLTSLSITEGETEIKLERKAELVQTVPAPVQIPREYPVMGMPVEEAPAIPEETAPIPEPVVDFNHLTEIKSPMVGVFYAAPSPDAEPFVKVGTKIKKGDVLCIIEAMKLMNEITAEQDGEIVDICVSSGEVVEYSQTLFKLF